MSCFLIRLAREELLCTPVDSSTVLGCTQYNYSGVMLNVGVSFSIFDDVVHSLPHFESEWLRLVCNFLCILQGPLRLDLKFVPEIQQVSNTFILDHVLDCSDFTNREIRKINYCRLYLQAIMVSNIFSAPGSKLMSGFRFGDYTIWSGVTYVHKTNQAKPNNSTWRLWSRAMNLIADSHDQLLVPLCQWIPPPHCQRFIRLFYFEPLSDSLYFSLARCFDYHPRTSGWFFSSVPTSQSPSFPHQLIQLHCMTSPKVGLSIVIPHTARQLFPNI
jgi:hypothetical protein